MNNKKSIKFMFKLQYYSVIINDPYIDNIRVVKQGVSDIIDIKPYVLLDGNVPINSALEDVSISKKNVFFYFKDFGYAKIKIKNLVNKKKYKNKSNWKIFKNSHITHIKNIPNEFKLSEELGYSSFGLFRSNWDSHLDTLIVSWDKLIKVNLIDILSKLKISPNYEVNGLAIDGNNNIIYIRLKNILEDDTIYIRSNFINLNYTDYKNWEIIKNKIGDKIMEKNNEKMSEKDIEEVMSSELEKEILNDTEEEDDDEPIEVEEQYMHHAMFPYEESTLDSDEDEDEDKENEEVHPSVILEKIKILDEFLNNNIKLSNLELSNQLINTIYTYNFKVFETLINMLYIGELFTIERAANGLFDSTISIKGYCETFKSHKNLTTRLRINKLNDFELEIILDLISDEEDSYFINFGRVRALINKGFDSVIYSISTPNGSIEDILKYAVYVNCINKLVNSKCRRCDKGFSYKCLTGAYNAPSNKLNINITDGIIEIKEPVINFLKTSNTFFKDIFDHIDIENKKYYCHTDDNNNETRENTEE